MTRILSIILTFLWIKGLLMATELKNIEVKGVKIPIIYEHNTQLPLFYVQISFKGAGGINNGKLYGLSEITSAILNEGTKKLGSTRFSQQLEQKALSLDVKSGLETIRFTLSGTAKEYQEGIKYLKDLIKDPNFTPGALKKVKQIALNSLLERENNFDYQAGKNLNAILFKNTPLEYPLSGTKETLKKITLRNIETFYKNSINLQSAIIVVGGDIEFTEVSKTLKTVLEMLPEGESPIIKPIEISKETDDTRQIKETQQAYIYFGSPLKIKDIYKESAMLKVASFVLGGSGFGSRIMEEIRVKRGLAYSAFMQLTANNTLAYAQGYLQTSLKNEESAKELVKKVVQDFVEKGITKEELQEAKQYLLGSEPLRNETLSQRLNTAFNNYYQNLPLDFNQEVLKNIASLSLEEINDYIKNHKEINELSFSIISAD